MKQEEGASEDRARPGSPGAKEQRDQQNRSQTMEDDVHDVVPPHLTAERLPRDRVQQEMHGCVVDDGAGRIAERVEEDTDALDAQLVDERVVGDVVQIIRDEGTLQRGLVNTEGGADEGGQDQGIGPTRNRRPRNRCRRNGCPRA